MLQPKKILAGLLIAHGTGIILWTAHSFTQALMTQHIRVDLSIYSYALVILLFFFGASSVAIGVWYQRHYNWVRRIVMAVAVAIAIAVVYAFTVVYPSTSSFIASLTFLALWGMPPLAIGTYLLKPVR
jgi:ribose/xylose/arabinose/galactoside ABC-type transport system permease subunit